MSDTLSDIQDAIDRFDFDTARSLLREALKNPTAETYYLASQVAMDDEQKIRLLRKSIEADPLFEKAISTLAKINPNHSSTSASKSITESVSKNVSKPPKSGVDEKANSEQQYIIGKVNQNAKKLYRVPFPSAPIRTSLPSNAQLAVFERTASGKWVNVLYVGSTDKPILGWIPVYCIEGFYWSTKKINILDIPITNFDFNSRDDIVDLISILNKERVKSLPYILGSITIFLFSLFFTDFSVNGFIAVLTLAGFIYGISQMFEVNKILNINLGWLGSPYENNLRLDRLRKSKQDVIENQMEHQAMMQANQIAGVILTKLTPEFKDIVNLTKGK